MVYGGTSHNRTLCTARFFPIPLRSSIFLSIYLIMNYVNSKDFYIPLYFSLFPRIPRILLSKLLSISLLCNSFAVSSKIVIVEKPEKALYLAIPAISKRPRISLIEARRAVRSIFHMVKSIYA
jgi:hypothetical protein